MKSLKWGRYENSFALGIFIVIWLYVRSELSGFGDSVYEDHCARFLKIEYNKRKCIMNTRRILS